MDIRTITSQWNDVNLDRINHNFSELRGIEYRAIQDMLSADPSKLTPSINGIEKPTELDLRSFNNYGVTFKAGVNGIIYKTSIYASIAGELGIGLAEQSPGSVAGATPYFKIVNLRRGWNDVVLNFPVEQNKSYTLYRKQVAETIPTAGLSFSPWNEFPFLTEGLEHFYGGMYLDQTGTSRHYTTFFEIQLITSLAQIYKIANDQVKPPQQFYVGDNPPLDAQFWFKPVGGN